MKYAYLYIVPFFLLQSCDYFSIKNEAKDAVARVNTTYLYKEDFDKFADCLQEVVNYIRDKQPEKEQEVEQISETANVVAETVKDFSDLEFEDI